MFFSFTWASISASLVFASALFYLKDVWLRRVEKPVLASWVLWSLIGLLLFLTSWYSGADWKTTLLPILFGVTNPCLMVLVILLRKHGAIGWSRTDTWCAFACVITVALWQTTNSAILGLVGAMVADIIAGIPQVLKNWKSPHEEVVLPWLMFSIGNALNLGSVPNWDSTLWVYPVYMAVMSFLIVLPVIVYRVKKMGAAK